jgi:hypothetical protein
VAFSRVAYLTTAEVAAGLPSNHAYQTADLEKIVDRASGYADSLLAPRFWTPFHAATDTPATPTVVRDIALLYSHWYARTLMTPNTRNIEESELNQKLTVVQSMVERLLRATPEGQLGPEQVNAELIAWGVWHANTVIDSSWHVFAAASLYGVPRDVIPESVVVTTAAVSTYYQNGYDFQTQFRPELNSWVLMRMNSAILSGAKVSYRFSHYKRIEKDDVKADPVGRVILT